MDDAGAAPLTASPHDEQHAAPAAPTARPARWRAGVPWRVALVAVLVAGAFVVLRWQAAADGDLGWFVQAGTEYADPDAPPSEIPLVEGYGFDGQFFWRFANDPFDPDVAADEGIHLDNRFRSQRLGYPFLAWVVSGGGRGDVALALVVVNVAAIGALAALGALEARRAGRTGWFGLAVASVPAFVYSLSRDLSEPVACAFLLAAVLAIRRERWGWAAAAFTGAVLTREQVAVVVAVYGLSRLWRLVRDRAWPAAADLPWLVPGLAFVALQAVLWARLGSAPALASGGDNSTLPFLDLVPAVGDWLAATPRVQHAVVGGIELPVFDERTRAVAELALLVGLVVVALLAHLPRRWQWERAAVAVLAVLAASLATVVWALPADLRTIADLAVLAWAVALAGASRRSLVVLGVATPLVALLPAVTMLSQQ